MGYLLDTGMLRAIEDGCRGLPDSMRRAPARWRGVLSVSGVVWGEFERERSGSAFKTALKADARFEGLAVLSLPLTDASLVESIRGEYPAGKATKNLGEVESLELLESLCPELTWASLDNGAVARALTRLGQHRLISPYELVLDLAERELLSRAEFDGVCLRMERKMQVILFPKRLKARRLRLAS